MGTGTVKFFNEAKGFGFIKDESGQEIFVHISGLKDSRGTLNEGDAVSFETEESPKGLNAVNVQRA